MSETQEPLRQLLPGLRAALAGFTQSTRLLRLLTPLGPNVLLAERLEGIERVSAGMDTADGISGFRLEILALAVDAQLSPQALLGHPVRLDLLTDQGPDSTRPFHGHVTAMEQLGSNGGFARYRLVVEPWLAFLRRRRDSYVFQNQSVPEIVDEVLGDYLGQGALLPAWRWQLAEASRYPPRSLCIQHQESDHDFVLRLLAEEGLFAWFEHTADAHTWVIGDSQQAFGKALAPATGEALGSLRFQRAAVTESADTLQRFAARAALGTQAVELCSWDYASLDTRPVSHAVTSTAVEVPALTVSDSPGAYRYPDRRQGERLARCRAEALAAQRGLIDAAGTVRRLAPGSTFKLTDHPRYASLVADDERGQFAVVQVEHRARNNLPADFSAALDRQLSKHVPSMAGGAKHAASASSADAPLYQNTLRVHPLSQPFAALPPEQGRVEGRASQRRLPGSLTATVVGLPGMPVTTDRDHRVKLQFHFARGSRSSSRQQHPAGDDNAPGGEASGAWVRVASPIAGSNWGGHFIPRVGQEVLVQFLDGDLDRPVVTGALYNGQGSAEAPGNEAHQTAPAHTANAPAWFAGNAHGAVFSGVKSMALGASATGQGGYNHLRFDDTPAQSSTQLASTQHSTTLTLGHHRGQDHGGEGLAGNLRTQGQGHGASVVSAAYGALRGGAGLLLSADHRPGATFSAGLQMDAQEAITQLGQAQQLTQSLIDTAKSQQAEGAAGEAGAASKPTVITAMEDTQAQTKTDAQTLGWAAPHLIQSAPGGIAQLTAGAAFYSAGTHWHTTSDNGFEALSQGASRYHLKDGIQLFTYGSKPAAQAPITEQGMRLHAGAGQVGLQAQSDEAEVKAKQDVRIASTSDQVSVHASTHVLMTAEGAYLKVEGDSVQLHAPGTVKLMASKKHFVGGLSAPLDLPEFPKLEGTFAQSFALYALEGSPLAGATITLFDPERREVIWQSAFDASGKTTLNTKPKAQAYMALVGFETWSSGFEDVDTEPGGEEEGNAEDSDEDGREEETKVEGDSHV